MQTTPKNALACDRAVLRWISGCVLLLLAGCSAASPGRAALPPQDPPAGHLLIVGGGLKDENEAIYGRFFELARTADAERTSAAQPGRVRVGVVPTATGEDSRGQDTIDVLRRYAGDAEVVLIPLMKEDIGKGDDPVVAEMIDSCDALWFVGGDQSRITAVFRPQASAGEPVSATTARRDTRAYTATLRLLARGGTIAGTSAGAAMMSDPMITGGSSADALEFGGVWTSSVMEGQGVGLAPGMGYLRGVLVDQHFLQRGRLGRLLVAMKATGTPLGAGVSENAALEVNRRTGEFRQWGEYGVFFVDHRGAR